MNPRPNDRPHRHPRRLCRAGPYSGESGITLIELMIALLIASLMVGLVFAIYTRMSVAYRSQQGVSELQQALRTVKRQMVKDVRAAGHLIPQGFDASDAVKTSLGVTPGLGNLVLPIMVLNDADAATWGNPILQPDKLRVFYADATAMAKIVAIAGPPYSLTVDDADTFEKDDIVLIVDKPSFPANADVPDGGADLVGYNACVMKITNIVGTTFSFDVDGHYNPTATPNPCDNGAFLPMAVDSMMYRFVGRSYRIDPTNTPQRRSMAVLQVHPFGEMEDSAGGWQDLGFGFTDLQLTQRVFNPSEIVDLDNDPPTYVDNDVQRNWYSATDTTTLPVSIGNLLELGINVAIRTTADLNVVPTAATPRFTSLTNPDHNRLGDSDSVTLDGSQPDLLQGKHIYRYFSVRVDLRNLGVGKE